MAGEIGKVGKQVQTPVNSDRDEDFVDDTDGLTERAGAALTGLKDHFVGLADEVKQVVLDPSKLKEVVAKANAPAMADLAAVRRNGTIDPQRFEALVTAATPMAGSLAKVGLTAERLATMGMPSTVASGTVAGMKLWGPGGLREVVQTAGGGRASLTGKATMKDGCLTVDQLTITPASKYSRTQKDLVATEAEFDALKSLAKEMADRGVTKIEVNRYAFMRPNSTEHPVKSLTLDLKKILGE